MVVSGVVCVGTSLALGEVLREVRDRGNSWKTQCTARAADIDLGQAVSIGPVVVGLVLSTGEGRGRHCHVLRILWVDIVWGACF